MNTYDCDDGNALVEIDHTSARRAAQEYVDDGYWGDGLKTQWIDVYVQRQDDEDFVDDDDERQYARECITIEIEPEEPSCSYDNGHDWQSPHALLGGLEENPGCSGHGGGILSSDLCVRCGCRRTHDSWAQRSDTGEQGLESIEYEPGYYNAEQLATVQS